MVLRFCYCATFNITDIQLCSSLYGSYFYVKGSLYFMLKCVGTFGAAGSKLSSIQTNKILATAIIINFEFSLCGVF